MTCQLYHHSDVRSLSEERSALNSRSIIENESQTEKEKKQQKNLAFSYGQKYELTVWTTNIFVEYIMSLLGIWKKNKWNLFNVSITVRRCEQIEAISVDSY